MTPKQKKSRNGAPENAKVQSLAPDTVPPGEVLTTNQGLQMSDDQNSLKAGLRGPTLLEDFHFREKITHFDNERIPERVVHARGAAAHGYFQVYKPLTELTKAAVFQDPSKKTPVFLRFSTVAGSRGSADTPRDVRGFAVKFYTDEGVWDLVGNNIPVFFIQDAIKFPDLIHAVKGEPHNEIPTAATAHDTFWDFISLTPESTHMLMWIMSDRTLPRSFATMEGFGIHTFRMVNAQGKSRFVKFHFKPIKGVHSLVWDESQKICGKDPDFQRRDMWEAIQRGDFLEWEMGLQVVEEKDERKFDFDLLDATKIIPEELVAVQRIGKLVLNRNPDNYFAETEQVAFHPGHIVPGLDFTNDPLLQGRLFSYIDTQLKRVGPNFAEIPINRPVCPVHNNQRDAQMRMTINPGRVSYFPNSLGSGCPAHSPEGLAAFSSYAEKMDGAKVRHRSPSFSDHFSQATLFWNSMADWEKQHIVDAFSFELNQVETKPIRERMIHEILAKVDGELAGKVAKNIGIAFKKPSSNGKMKKPKLQSSPALSMDKPIGGIKGRNIAVLAADGVSGKNIADLRKQLEAEGAAMEIIAFKAGTIETDRGDPLPVTRPTSNAPSVVFDAVFIPDGPTGAETQSQMMMLKEFVQEAFAHCKTIAAVGHGVELLQKAQLVDSENGKMSDDHGLVTGGSSDASAVLKAFVKGLKQHRHYARQLMELSEMPA